MSDFRSHQSAAGSLPTKLKPGPLRDGAPEGAAESIRENQQKQEPHERREPLARPCPLRGRRAVHLEEGADVVERVEEALVVGDVLANLAAAQVAVEGRAHPALLLHCEALSVMLGNSREPVLRPRRDVELRNTPTVRMGQVIQEEPGRPGEVVAMALLLLLEGEGRIERHISLGIARVDEDRYQRSEDEEHENRDPHPHRQEELHRAPRRKQQKAPGGQRSRRDGEPGDRARVPGENPPDRESDPPREDQYQEYGEEGGGPAPRLEADLVPVPFASARSIVAASATERTIQESWDPRRRGAHQRRPTT